jgi:hypothetical protein
MQRTAGPLPGVSRSAIKFRSPILNPVSHFQSHVMRRLWLVAHRVTTQCTLSTSIASRGAPLPLGSLPRKGHSLTLPNHMRSGSAHTDIDSLEARGPHFCSRLGLTTCQWRTPRPCYSAIRSRLCTWSQPGRLGVALCLIQH